MCQIVVCSDLEVFMFETIIKVIAAFSVPGVAEHIMYLDEICFFLSIQATIRDLISI